MPRGGGANKKKGSKWERQVCRTLSLWVTSGKIEDVYWRSAMSGGRATFHRKKGRKTADAAAGDICAIRPEGNPFLNRFFVECKATVNLHLDAYLGRTLKGKIEDHWSKPCRQAKEQGKEPFVILKRNHMDPIVYVRSEVRVWFNKKCGPLGGVPRPIGSFPLYRMYIYSLNDLLKVLDPAWVIR